MKWKHHGQVMDMILIQIIHTGCIMVQKYQVGILRLVRVRTREIHGLVLFGVDDEMQAYEEINI